MSKFNDPLLDTLILKDPDQDISKGRDISVNRYYRITPQFIRALCGYLDVPIGRLLIMVGMSPHDFTNFQKHYHPSRNFGSQVAFQCGIYFVVKLLYHRKIIPYPLAQLAGVYDREGFAAERRILRENIANSK